jgi:hypothetical protein
MKNLAGKSTLLVAAVLGFQQLATGLSIGLNPRNLANALDRRAELPTWKFPTSDPDPAPVANPGDHPDSSTSSGQVGEGDSSGETTGTSQPHIGQSSGSGTSAPAPAPVIATLGTDAEKVAMGLKPGTNFRTAFDNFENWFISSGRNAKTQNPWVFFTRLGEDGNTAGGDLLVPNFQEGFAAGKYRQPGDAPASSNDKIQQMSDAMNPSSLPQQISGAVPKTQPKFWYDMVASYGVARLAAATGGKARILMPKGADNAPKETFWAEFEAYTLTGPDSKVQELWRYDSDSFTVQNGVKIFTNPPTLIWKQGQAPLGTLPDFTKVPDRTISLDF